MHCTQHSPAVEKPISQDILRSEFNRFVDTFNDEEHREPSRFECYQAGSSAGTESRRVELELVSEWICSLPVPTPKATAMLMKIQRIIDIGNNLDLGKNQRTAVAEVNQALAQALRDIGLALCASDGSVTTDLPGAVVSDTSWRIDHTQELAQLEVLKAALGIVSSDTAP